MPPSETMTARLGFGCASLGSRISPPDAEAALKRAYDAGIAWFDVAPSYGDGQAEAILGRFARKHRDRVTLCTKVGIEANVGGWKAAIRPLARNIVAAFPALRRYATRARTVAKLPLDPDTIRQSAERSLASLGTDRIDLLMLHDPIPGDVLREDIAEAMTALIRSGKVAALGVAGDMDAARNAATRPDLYSTIQFANNPFAPNADADFVEAWRAEGKRVVTHSALGAHGALAELSARLASDSALRRRFDDAGYAGPTQAADFLTDYALSTNPGGVTLFSAARPDHLAALVDRAHALPRDVHMLRALATELSSRIDA